MVETRHNGIRRTSLTQSLVLISVFYPFTLGSSNFQLVDQFKTYQEAKSYCRDMYTDLVTVHNLTVMNELITLVTNKTPRAWIGLESADVRVWHWSQPDQRTDFFNWKLGEPQGEDQDTCVAMDQHGQWFESECTTTRSFVCQDNNNYSKHVLVNETKSWRDAHSHCRDLSSELVSIHTIVENAAVQNVSALQVVWIGLFKDSWMWSDGSNSSFRFWRPNQPNYSEDQYCTVAVFRLRGQWNDLRCSGKHWFICYGEKKTLSTTASTEIEKDTTSYSPNRNLTTQTPSEAATSSTVTLTPDMTELPSTTDRTTTEEETTVSEFATSPQMKTRSTTTSSQNEDDTITTDSPTRTTQMMTSTPEMTELPTTTEEELPTTTTEEEEELPTTKEEELPTTKEEALPTTKEEELPTTTEEEALPTTTEEEGLPTTKEELPTTTEEEALPTTTEEEELPTTTEEEELPTTKEEELPTTTEEEATASEFASSPSTELYSRTTETSTVTVTQSTETLDLTTVIDSSTPFTTSVQSTTHSSNLTPTVSSPSSSDNLILIQENMTWIEAMGYCRENHMDLVNILNKQLQDEVAEKAKSATTAYVWMGLRYNCKFEFWFWTSSSSGCYQSWASGHGSEWEYECGVSGAVEATGRHQWVGLPQGNKLNFICSTCLG
ncbi:nucleoporin nsp1-like isoform X2 [Gouania willdenowi]|uniref:Mucin-12-like n=1 Tax=Gouania willdenowi TaxID=441366 RepID=A0A8C5DF16_GOUWI|nr:nucleoporin nsp1-like isoform X2 [Gouania willdenowi]